MRGLGQLPCPETHKILVPSIRPAVCATRTCHKRSPLHLQGTYASTQWPISTLYPFYLQLEEHNSQITELQGAWERAKEEEEGRGGGAADARRWTGVRSGVEARELLRTVFRVACDYK